jgi:MFS family permease
MALLPSLVKRQHLNTAIGLNSVTFNLARFIGPALAGLIVVVGELAWLFALNALSFLIFLIVLYRLRIDAPTKPARSGKRFLSDVGEGLSFALHAPRIALPLALMLAVSAGARPVVELLPGLAATLLSGDASTLALLTSTMGLGAIVGGLWLAGRRRGNGLSSVVTTAAVAIGLGLFTLAMASSLWLALPAAAFLGLALVVTGAGAQTLLQLNVPGEMRGRVMSLYGLIVRGGPAIGALVMGAAAEWYGLRWPLAAGAIIVAGAAIFLRRRKGWHG